MRSLIFFFFFLSHFLCDAMIWVWNLELLLLYTTCKFFVPFVFTESRFSYIQSRLALVLN